MSIEKIRVGFNRTRISAYEGDEYSALEIMSALQNKTNEVIENINTLSNSNGKKLSVEEYEKDMKENRKLDKYGNFKGSWHGISHPVETVDGANAVLKEHIEKFKILDINTFDNLQQFFDSLENGSVGTFKGEFVESEFILQNVENIHLFSCATISQNSPYILNQTYENPISHHGCLMIKNCKNVVIDGFVIFPQYEGIIVEGCENITIKNVTIDGKNKSKYNGISVSNSKNVVIENSTIKNIYTMPTWNGSTNVYSIGNGVGFYLSERCKVETCNIMYNAQNGLYSYASSHLTYLDNKIYENGMSGIQIAFGYGTEKNFFIHNNTIFDNYSDGIDINNTMNKEIDISCLISSNTIENNGFFAKDKSKITQDGSGLSTLINVNNVTISKNILLNSARSGLHIHNGKNIIVEGNYCLKEKNGVSTMFTINCSKNVVVNNNVLEYYVEENEYMFAIDSNPGDCLNITFNDNIIYSHARNTFYTKGNNKADCVVNGGVIESYNAPTHIDDIIYKNVKFKCKMSNAVTLAENVEVVNCEFISEQNTGVNLNNNCRLINCKIKGNVYGVLVENVNNCHIINCEIYGNSGITVVSGDKILILANKCKAVGSASIHVRGGNVTLSHNYVKSDTGNGIRLENESNVTLISNFSDSPDDYQNATIKNMVLQ